ncbi:MAG: ATP-binding protein, partial [Bacteroidetes bacterium]|nr:ATP-binding protein [Bacteroidota bacterium]
MKQKKLNGIFILEAKNEERRRIARDMHDDLGSGLSKFAVITELAKNNNSLEQTKHNLSSISQTSQGLLDNMGTLIWALNPDNASLQSLLSKMREFASDYFENLPIRVSAVFPFESPETLLPTDYQRNIFLFFKEALNNAVKHASAKNISIKIELANSKTLEITISDDGCGFDLKTVNHNGNGIVNMQSRV